LEASTVFDFPGNMSSVDSDYTQVYSTEVLGFGKIGRCVVIAKLGT
jgi:hypothetical protein